MKTTTIGQQAESAVAEELKRLGYEILAQNWKTKVCEIDIVARKASIVYFVEVKYRSSMAQGNGLEYIGPQKLRRLHFAARIWTQSFDWQNDYRLVAAAVASNGISYVVEEILELD